MTAEEAIKQMRAFSRCHYEKPNGDADLKVYEALDIAIEALQKQIQVRPFGMYRRCPRCKSIKFDFKTPNYCENCGQALKRND